MQLSTAEPADLSLQLHYFGKLIYSMQQQGISVIQQLILNNRTAKENLDVTIATQPSFAPTVTRHIARLEADSSLELEGITLDWNPERLSQLQEAQGISLTITIKQGEEVLLEEKHPLEILPADTWIGAHILPELLCAFVTPNAPEIPLILQRAAVLLQEWSGSASFTAYQSCNEDRVRQQMAAIYQAVAELGIVYNLPPASFEETGQRVRMVDKVYEQRLGTCLDMALFYASCLEAIGLHPILVIIKGHAFVGSWLIEDLLNDPVSDDISIIRKRIAKGINEMSFIEATSMNAACNISFEESTRHAHEHFVDESKFIFAIDVKRCRLSRIRPLLCGTQGMAAGSAFKGQAANSSPISLAPRQVMEAVDTQILSKQSVWERKLLDLSLRNNLLNVRRTRSLIPLMSAQLPLLEDALADGKDFVLMPRPSDWKLTEEEADNFHAITESEAICELVTHELNLGRLHSFDSEAEAQKNYTHLYRSARLAMEENGANTLYLALGLLRWYESPLSERPRFAPILLLPVEMKRRRGVSGGYSIRSSEEEIMVNITLLEMLKQDFAIDLSVITQLPRDEHGVDITLIFNTLRNLLKDQARWDVEEQALLGTFSFSKFIMWNDIHNNADLLRRNTLVDSLISGQIKWTAPEEEELQLDTQLRPSDMLLPVPADSYQMEAVYRATVLGQSFVLHGPPGSGKSQTITNIIANALYRGQRVLFVAEKMAALSVVHQRLSQIGLGPFCLELHSNKATKTSALSQLEAAAQYKQGQTSADFEGESDRLYQLRHELRLHVDALHESLPLGLSLYESLYAIEQLPPAAHHRYKPAEGTSTRLSRQDWRDAREGCAQLQSIAKITGSPATHALRHVNRQDFTPELKEQANQGISELLQAYQNLVNAYKTASLVLDLPEQEPTLARCEALCQCIKELLTTIPHNPALLQVDNTLELLRRSGELVACGKNHDLKMDDLEAIMQLSALSVDATTMLRQWQEAAPKWFLPRWWTSSRLLKQLRLHLAPHQGLNTDNLGEALQRIIDAQEAEQALSKLRLWQDEHFGELKNDWAAISTTAQSTHQLNIRLLDLLGDISVVKAVRQQIAEQLSMGKAAFIHAHGAKLSNLTKASKAVQEQENKVNTLLQVQGLAEELAERLKQLEGMREHIDQLRDWCHWKATTAKLDEGDDSLLGDFIRFVEQHELPPAQLQAEYERGIYHELCNSQVKRHPHLAQFNGLIFEERLGKYRELIQLNQELARLELCAKLGSQIPNMEREAAQNSELGILQRSIRSKGRGLTIRQLFDKLPELMPRLKPCMLMSPMSVAQYIDAGSEPFDLVIFDEASQMPTCDAVGTIARGKNIIVVGDPKQMPPTSFFSSNSVDEEHLELEDLESILEDCLGLAMPSRYLRWHYRSKHESLIAFSNAQYYENMLLTFPSPDDQRSKLSFIPVEGYYDKGKSRCNRAEAEAIVNEVLSHLADASRNQRSLGIISFSQVQQSLIEDLLTQALSKPSNAQLEALAFGGEEPIFVKNLENVQGDERDVIYFSVGYGPDEAGRVSHNFGPLNREGGERRLNVAVSRARYEMKVFSTLSPEQIELSRTKSLGVAGLKAFLEFAQKGKMALPQKSGSAHVPQASLIDKMAEELQARGFEIKKHVGSSAYRIDLAVVHPDKPEDYLAAIICDGASYQAAPTLRDREITRVGVLRALGWNVLRLWTLDWWMEHDKVMEQLCSALEELKHHQQEEEKIHIDIQATLTEAPTVAERKCNYQVVELASIDCGDEDPLQAQFTPQMMEQITAILAVESPVKGEYLMRRLMGIWGLKVLNKRVQTHFEQLFTRMQLHRSSVSEGDYTLWSSEEQAANYGIYRIGGGREAKYIPIEELTLASYEVLQQQLAMPREDLQAQLIELFDLGRKTKALRSSVDAGIAHALQIGYIVEEEGRCKLP